MRHQIRIILTLIIFGLMAGCAKKDQEVHRAAPTPAGEEFAKATGAERTSAKSEATDEVSEGDIDERIEQGARLVIHNADLTITVEEPLDASSQAHAVADTLGGFVVSSSNYGGDVVGRSDVTLRIPSDSFDQALVRLRGLGEVQNESVSGEDVTAEFVDLEARLKVQRNLETRYIVLLSQSETVVDTIAVEKELARVRSEIEQMEGRRKYLANQAQLATIRLHLATPETMGDRGALSEIGEAFSDSGDIMVAVVAGGIRVISALLPIALVLGLFVFGVVRLLRRRRMA